MNTLLGREESTGAPDNHSARYKEAKKKKKKKRAHVKYTVMNKMPPLPFITSSQARLK